MKSFGLILSLAIAAALVIGCGDKTTEPETDATVAAPAPGSTQTPPVTAPTQAPPAAAEPAVTVTVVPPDENTSPFLTEANFVTTWNVLGPITFGEGDFGGDQQQAAARNAFVTGEARLTDAIAAPAGATWQEVTFDQGMQAGQCNLDTLYDGVEHAAAYAVVNLQSPAEIDDAKLYVGSDDYITVWINGEQVLQYDDQRRGSDWDQDVAEGVHLNAGDNHVVVKVVDVVGGFDFYFRLTDADDMPMAFAAE